MKIKLLERQNNRNENEFTDPNKAGTFQHFTWQRTSY
jgi:hypothetical protein